MFNIKLNPFKGFKNEPKEEIKQKEPEVVISYTIDEFIEAQNNFSIIMPGLYRGVVKGIIMDKTRNGYDVLTFLVKYEDHNQRKVTWINAKHILNSQNLVNAVPPLMALLNYYGIQYQYDGNPYSLKQACEVLINKEVMVSVNTNTNQYGKVFTSILINPYMNM